MKVAVIGAGPSGLVTLKYLKEAHSSLGCVQVDARLFEYQPQVGGTFVARVYEDAELVSSKQLTTFSDFRDTSADDFLSATAYVEYLKGYCTRFDLWPYINLNTRVVEVKRRSPLGHTVVYNEDDKLQEWDCDAVAVCSGLHVEPNLPDIPGIARVPRVIHSSDFKARKQFKGSKTVMVVGSGETGADIAYLAVTTPFVERVLLCHRDGLHFAPKRNPGPVILPILGRKPNPNKPGIPIDISRANLFDTAYVHKTLRQNDMLLWGYYNLYIKSLLFISSGTLSGFDQWIGEISPERHHPSKIFFNKSMKVCPYVSQPYRPQLPGPKLWIYTLRSVFVQTPIPDTNGRHVDLAPWPRSFDRRGTVKFVNNGRLEYDRLQGQEIRPDMVVLCTGYQQSFPFLDCSEGRDSLPYPTPDKTDVRNVWKRDDPSVGFIGFIRPSLGAIPPLSEMQAQLWITHLLAPQTIPRPLVPEDEPHYRLLHLPGSRINYGVDHETYAYQLALDMDSAPGLCDIVRVAWQHRGASFWKLLLIWAFGANINAKFRLQGPWKSDGAAAVLASDEIWHTITRRPIIFGHFAVSIMPMSIFGPISLLCWVHSTIVELLCALGVALVTSSEVAGPPGSKLKGT